MESKSTFRCNQKVIGEYCGHQLMLSLNQQLMRSLKRHTERRHPGQKFYEKQSLVELTNYFSRQQQTRLVIFTYCI